MKTCIGLIAGHSGDSLTDELHKRGFKVAIVGGQKNEPGMNKADFTFVEDLANHQKIISFFNKHKVNKIIIGTGHVLAINLSKHLEENSFKTNIDYSKSMLAKDKVNFKKELIKLKIKTPEFINISNHEYRSVDKIINEIKIPCVVKSSIDAIQPVKVNSRLELTKAIQNVQSTNTVVLIEEYIKGNDCTVAVVNDGENVSGLGVIYYSKSKEYKLKGFDEAYSKKVTTEKECELNDIAINIVKKLGIKGLSRVDFVIDEENEKNYVLEINTVIVTGYHGSSYPFFKDKGIDIGKVMVSNALKLLGEIS